MGWWRWAQRLFPTIGRPKLLAAHRLEGKPQQSAFAALARIYQAAAAIMAKLRETDIAWVAAERAIAAAERSGDPLLAAAGDFRLAHVFLSGDQLSQAERVVNVATAALAPRLRDDSPPHLLSVWGALHLVGAVVASRQERPETALANMRRAQEAADRLRRSSSRRQRHDGSRGTGLSLHTGRSKQIDSWCRHLNNHPVRVMPRPSREASIAAWLSRCWPCSVSI